jgi:large subunit ribosomal protein L21
MYAVIETGGKQYRVAPGDVIDVELFSEDREAGTKVSFDRVLMVGGGDEGSIQIGAPLVGGATVAGSLVAEIRGPKIRVFKFKRRKGYRKTQGHRQDMQRVRIDEINLA